MIGIKNGRNFSFQHCDLFGCGTEGLTLEKVQGLRFEHSIIRDCSYGIMSAKASRDLVFRSSRFTNNREFWGVQLNDCRDVLFEACVFTGNELDGPLFSSTSSSEIHIRNGAIANNKVSALCPPGSPIKLQNVARTLDRP